MIVVSRAARRSIVWALLAAFGPAASDTLAQSALPFRIPISVRLQRSRAPHQVRGRAWLRGHPIAFQSLET